jgi:RHS repeat-associated protein
MAVTKYIYDGDTVLQETDGAGAVQAEYTWTGDGYGDLLSAFDGSAAKYYEPDALGSTDALADQSQSVVDRWAYRAFGQATQTAGTDTTPFTWVGREGYVSDGETGFYLLGSGTRYYDHAMATFLSRDPIGLDGGDANTYRYVQHSPVVHTDPLGLQGFGGGFGPPGGGLQPSPPPGWVPGPGGPGYSPPVPLPPPSFIVPRCPPPSEPPKPPIQPRQPPPLGSPENPRPVELPLPTEGCEGWCFDADTVRIISMTLTKVIFYPFRLRGGCPWLLKPVGIQTATEQIRKMLSNKFKYVRCSGEGCSCKNKNVYDGQTIILRFRGDEEIALDPNNLESPVNDFKLGECFVKITGTATIKVTKGWVGQCST